MPTLSRLIGRQTARRPEPCSSGRRCPVHRSMGDSRQGSDPAREALLWELPDPGAAVRAHVSMRQFEPCPGESIGELIRMFQKAMRDFFVSRIDSQREVGRQQRRPNSLRRIVGMRHGAVAGAILRLPLVRSGRTLRQFPFEAEQIPEEVVSPPGGRAGPGDFQTAGDRIGAGAGAKLVLPAQALLFEAGRFRIGPNVRRRCRSVGLAEGVAAGDQPPPSLRRSLPSGRTFRGCHRPL